MKRKLYSVEYINELERKAQEPVMLAKRIEKTAAAICMYLIDKDLQEDFEQYVKENHPELAEELEID